MPKITDDRYKLYGYHRSHRFIEWPKECNPLSDYEHFDNIRKNKRYISHTNANGTKRVIRLTNAQFNAYHVIMLSPTARDKVYSDPGLDIEHVITMINSRTLACLIDKYKIFKLIKNKYLKVR
jgi:hypothetical protein